MGNTRAGLLEAITNPLGFFGLTMLIIEGILGLVVGTSKMSGDQQFCAFLILVGLCVVVIALVTVMAIVWPRSLLAKVTSDLDQGRSAAQFLRSPAFKDFVVSYVAETVKPDVLIKPDAGRE